MFEKLGLIKKTQPNDPRKCLKWKDYIIGERLDMTFKLRRWQELFKQKGPIGLIEMFFEPEECDRIVLSLQEFQLFPA
jgi:hypothetical protein